MNVQITAIALAVSLALGGFSGWKLHGWKDAADREAYERGQAKALQAAAAEIAKIDVKQITINRKVQTEILEKPVYSECIIPISGVRLIRDAYGAESTDGKNSSVPTFSPTRGQRNDNGSASSGNY